MSVKKNIAGIALAAAAAALFTSGMTLSATAAAAEEGKVKCSGINSCKGHSECATASSSCKGQNSCKGKGWIYSASGDACKDAGGSVVTG